MSFLPKIESPVYTVKLPVSELTVKYRPYTVREQKILAMGKESGDPNTLVDAIKQIIANCTLDSIDTEELSISDSEFLFYQLRARSESEIVELKYRCENTLDDGTTCNNIMDYDLNLLTELETTKSDISPTIEVSDKVGLKLKYQKLEHTKIGDTIPTPDETLEIIARNVEFIYDETSVYNAKDIPVQNIVAWLGDLPIEQYTKIEEFFANEPKIVKKLDIVCKKCGFDHHITVRDIFDFFI